MVIKSNYPILEVDTEQRAVIMPDRDEYGIFPQKCVFAFLGEKVDEYSFGEKIEVIGEFESITKVYKVYRTIYKGEEICYCQAPCGAAPATQILDFLIGHGVKYIVACGSCGALKNFAEDEIIIPISALRDEGTSYHYLPPAREIEIDSRAIKGIKKAVSNLGLQYTECKTWTTDGFFRETKDMVTYRMEEGCSVVEMECSALASCAKFRDVIFGQILFTADSLANLEEYSERNFGISSYDLSFELSLEAVCEIEKI